MAQTRTVAPASGVPRELKTMSSLRVPCACTGRIAPGTTYRASASNAQKNVIVIARSKRDAIFNSIILALVRLTGTPRPKPKFTEPAKVFDRKRPSDPMYFFDLAVRRRTRSVDLHDEILKKNRAGREDPLLKVLAKTRP